MPHHVLTLRKLGVSYLPEPGRSEALSMTLIAYRGAQLNSLKQCDNKRLRVLRSGWPEAALQKQDAA